MSDSEPDLDAAENKPVLSPDGTIISSEHNDVIAQAVDSISSAQEAEDIVTTADKIINGDDLAQITSDCPISSDDHSLVASHVALVAAGGDSMVLGATSGGIVEEGSENEDLLDDDGDNLTTANGHILASADGGIPHQFAVSDSRTLQNLLSASGGGHLTSDGNDTIQIIQVSNGELVGNNGNIWHVLPSGQASDVGMIIALNQAAENEVATESLEGNLGQDGGMTSTQVVDMVPVSSVSTDGITSLLMPPPHPVQNLPPGCPVWAARLRDCEKIGDAYRGWVESEVELDLLLTYHKQHTQSFWGTRQSPSPAKQTTRLMWKSQYVPFDGIPFVNTGSRAIVMECQYGPRRKGAQAKKPGETVMMAIKGEFKQTCPARIYIKKVKKFPEFAVDTSLDKKSVKTAMEKAFQLLKERGFEGYGQERFYVQLPTEKAHEFHADVPKEEPVKDAPHRLHPKVSQRIRDLVSAGETRLYVIRKALRRFVERDLTDDSSGPPEKHNLSLYPTVNDLQNHIHQALRDIESGILPMTASTVNVEVMGGGSSDDSSQDIHAQMWDDGMPHAETVTVTLTQNPDADGQHMISKVETHLSDGSTRVSSHLTLETAQLLAKLHPNMFPSGSLIHVQGAESGTGSQVPKLNLETESMPDEDQDKALSGELQLIEKPTEVDLQQPLTSLQATQDADQKLALVSQFGAHFLQPTLEGGVQVLSEGDVAQNLPVELHMGEDTIQQLAGVDPSRHLVAIVTGEDGQLMLQYRENEDAMIKEEQVDGGGEDDDVIVSKDAMDQSIGMALDTSEEHMDTSDTIAVSDPIS